MALFRNFKFSCPRRLIFIWIVAISCAIKIKLLEIPKFCFQLLLKFATTVTVNIQCMYIYGKYQFLQRKRVVNG